MPYTDRPTPRPLRALSLGLVLALLSGAAFIATPGCSTGRSITVQESTGSRWVRNGDEWKIRMVDPSDASILTAELKVEREESNGIAYYRLERVELFPPGDPMPRLWRLLPPRSQLRAPDGTVLVHPDVALLDSLGDAPTLDEALPVLPLCLHFDSRGEALARVAGGRDGRRSFDALIEILALGSAGPLGDPTPDDVSAPIGGSSRRASAPALIVLATRTDLTPVQFGALAPLVDRFPTRDQRTKFLKRLIGKASTVVIAEAVPSLATSSERGTIVEILARQRDLTEEDMIAICKATTTIGSSSRQTAALLELAPYGPVGPILDATSHIGSSSGRTEVMLALAGRRPLSAEEASAIARDSQSIGSSSGQTRVVESLVDVAPVADIISAAETIGSPSGRSTVLTTLARQPGLPSESAAAIARATVHIGSSSGQTEVLDELIGTAPTASIIAGAGAIPSSRGRGQLLAKLARQPQLTRADANAIAVATPQIGSANAQTTVLLALVGTASVPTIIEAMTAIPSVTGRGEVLLHLASASGLEAESATAIAGAVAHVSSSSTTAGQILRRLIGHAPVEVILTAASSVPSSNERYEVFIALARAPKLDSVDAKHVAEATRFLSTSGHQAEILTALISRAPPSDIRAAASHITSRSRREALLEKLESSVNAENPVGD